MKTLEPSSYIAKRFNCWTVLSGATFGKHPTVWAKCDCGDIREVARDNILSGKSKKCRKCSGKGGRSNSGWRGHKDVPQQFFGIAQRSAAARGYEFNLTIEDVQTLWDRSGGKCALSGISIKLDTKHNGCTASMDRIDSKRGYVMDNIQFVHKDVNLMKNHFQQEYFVEMCKRIASCAGG